MLNNKVIETKKNEYSAWEPITPFRLYEKTNKLALTKTFSLSRPYFCLVNSPLLYIHFVQ